MIDWKNLLAARRNDPSRPGKLALFADQTLERARRTERAEAESDRYRRALLLIGMECETFTGPLTCVDDSGRTPDGKYLVDRWCDGCISRTALIQPGKAHRA
jgi:hypothetical protein